VFGATVSEAPPPSFAALQPVLHHPVIVFMKTKSRRPIGPFGVVLPTTEKKTCVLVFIAKPLNYTPYYNRSRIVKKMMMTVTKRRVIREASRSE